MNREEFQRLRDLPDKIINTDINFELQNGLGPNLVFSQIRVENSQDLDIILNGTFKPDIPSVTFNFVLKGVGPICRVDVNGTIHGNAGRTHKHDLRRESDPRQSLPTAFARPDLEGKTAREVWEILCEQAHIIHQGHFHDPE